VSAIPSSGAIEGGRHILPLRVYYEDTDFSGVVYHASYLRFFERGRTELLRAVGFDQRALHDRAQPVAFAVRRMTIDFLKPAHMDDVVSVQTRPTLVRPALLDLLQIMTRGDQRLAACRVSVMAIAGGRARRIPSDLVSAMTRLAAAAAQGAARESGS
jgi:acyl-CoA thioester hydrolase